MSEILACIWPFIQLDNPFSEHHQKKKDMELPVKQTKSIATETEQCFWQLALIKS